MYIRRKVYSDFADYDYFYDEPQLYSVTMDEDELALFSEFEDAYYEALYSDQGDASGLVGATAGLAASGAAGAALYKNRDRIKNRINKKWNDGFNAREEAKRKLQIAHKDRLAGFDADWEERLKRNKGAMEEQVRQRERARLNRIEDMKSAYGSDYKKHLSVADLRLVTLKSLKADAKAELNKQLHAEYNKASKAPTSKRLLDWAKKNPKAAAAAGITAAGAGTVGAMMLGGAAGKALGRND